MARTLATSRFNTILLTTLGVMGLVLSAIGIYGVIAYFVSQRTKEIGVRLALGASPGDVVRLVIRQALKPVLVGLVLGVAGAIAASGVLAAQLYGVTPRDPLTIVVVSVMFVVVAIVASWAPGAPRVTRRSDARARRCGGRGQEPPLTPAPLPRERGLSQSNSATDKSSAATRESAPKEAWALPRVAARYPLPQWWCSGRAAERH